MQVEDILNRIENYKGFVYQRVRRVAQTSVCDVCDSESGVFALDTRLGM